MNNMEICKEKTGKHNLHLISTKEDLENGIHIEVDITCDGCLHIERFIDGTIIDEKRDYIHICNPKDFIKLMEICIEEAKKYFGDDWEDGL